MFSDSCWCLGTCRSAVVDMDCRRGMGTRSMRIDDEQEIWVVARAREGYAVVSI